MQGLKVLCAVFAELWYNVVWNYYIFLFIGFQKLLDRFDYDDEPEGGEETKRDEALSVQPALYAMI